MVKIVYFQMLKLSGLFYNVHLVGTFDQFEVLGLKTVFFVFELSYCFLIVYLILQKFFHLV